MKRRINKTFIENIVFLTLICVTTGVVGFGIGIGVSDILHNEQAVNQQAERDAPYVRPHSDIKENVVLTPWIQGIHSYSEEIYLDET